MEEKKKKKGFNKKLLLLLVIPVLIALGVVIGSYISGNDGEKEEVEEEEILHEQTMVLDEFVLNLEPTGNINRYIRLELALSTVKENGLAEMEDKINTIRDVIIYEVSKESVDNIFQDDNMSFALKNKLKTKINERLDDDLIYEVYISNIIIQ